MRTELCIAAAQPPCVARDVRANARLHAQVVRAAGARVVVFPELSLTGYELDAPPVDPVDLAPLVAACAETGTLALAGAPVAGPSIGVLAVDGDGVRVAYRKIYLGAEETAHHRAGDAPAVVEVDGWRLGLAVCRDTGIPRHAADTAALGIDVYVAGVVDRPEDAAVQEERARRVVADHGVAVVIASCAAPTGFGYDRTAGRSGIWPADGSAPVRAGAEPGDLAVARIR
ncbi:carbon-nitrogen hydrolase family protein [Pseudonocardia sp. WMMC193]|uniref:carbon-nitrogen hydrolase family protein n=1 Tax=Pseudonocardia sp. WMMC193 TaxID=2911965 RepID=UPI001F386E6A|nr:carbon-nitrogen hydrolase family protein [Pseudonocardia sp. WMMC193]MCF7553047.1 carbon-nitrogen hydrolase family protein [Pseudonocardia sp. WMMC193]